MSTPYPPSALLEWDGWLTVQTASCECDCPLHLHASGLGLGTALSPCYSSADSLLALVLGFIFREFDCPQITESVVDI